MSCVLVSEHKLSAALTFGGFPLLLCSFSVFSREFKWLIMSSTKGRKSFQAGGLSSCINTSLIHTVALYRRGSNQQNSHQQILFLNKGNVCLGPVGKGWLPLPLLTTSQGTTKFTWHKLRSAPTLALCPPTLPTLFPLLLPPPAPSKKE